ncbi:ABC transporter ATP-binding protein [Alcaligenaceae bacterium]|nr:ABC transporter ATP-binding protein [Alcaligenaceae bacterium]
MSFDHEAQVGDGLPEIAISAEGLGKQYHIYSQPHQRLLQMLYRGRKTFFQPFDALQGLSFQVRRGETVGIIGRNGAGKSTLLQLLCGTLAPSTGNITVNGRVAALLELGAGFNPEYSGRENVFLNAAILGLSREQAEARFDDIAAFADIGQFIDQPVKTYSSGMYVRLAFAVIAHVDADILIIDEALAVGDAHFTQKCMRFLRKFCEAGTLLFVSHDSAAVTSLCERAIWLEHGRMRAIGPARDICKEYNAEVYQQPNGVTAARPRPQPAEPASGHAPAAPRRRPQAIDAVPQEVFDGRWDRLADTPLRNAMTVQAFDAEDGFGTGQMRVRDVFLEDADGTVMASITGGEVVSLVVRYVSHLAVDSVIVGFQFKDKRGQILFGDNTCISTMDEPVPIGAGETQECRFRFQMPLLPAGEYAVTVSVAEGTQVDHIQHHWVHDALIVQSLCASVSTGIVGIPMLDIRIDPVGVTTEGAA